MKTSGSMISLSQPKAEAYGAHSGGRFTFVLRLSVLALAAPRLQLEEEHEASQNFIVNDTSGQTRPQGARLLLCLRFTLCFGKISRSPPVMAVKLADELCFCGSVAGGAEA